MVKATIFLPLMHNIYFGNSFILFTGAVFTDANIKITLNDYVSLLTTFDISNEKKDMMTEMLLNFFNPFEIHKYFIIIGIILSLKFIHIIFNEK